MRCRAANRNVLAGLFAGCLFGLLGAAALAREPVLVVSVAGVERLLADVDYLSDLADRPEIAGFVRGIQGMVNNLKGLDKTRPIRLMAYLPDGASAGAQPEVALLVPVKNVAELQKTIGSTKRLTLTSGEAEGDYILEGPQKKVPVRIADGWAVVSEKADLLSEPSLRADRWESLLGTSDIACYVAWNALPPRIVDEALDKMTRDREKERPRRDGEDEIEFSARQLGMDVMLKSGERVLRELEGISFSLDVNEKGKRLEAELQFAPRPGTVLAEQFARLQTATQFAPQTASSDALLVTFCLASPEILHEGLGGLVEQGRRQADEKIADEGERGLVGRILDVVADVLGGRVYDGFLRVVPSETHRLSVVAGTRCSKDGELAGLLGQVLPEAAKSSDVKGLTVDAIVLDDVRIHRIEPAKTREEDEKLFGTEASVFIGTGRGAIWGALGGPETAELVKATVAPAAAAPNALAANVPSPLFAVVIHLKKWAGFFEQASDEPEHVRSAIAGVLKEAEADEVALRLHAAPTGLKLRLTADDSALRAILAGIRAKQNE